MINYLWGSSSVYCPPVHPGTLKNVLRVQGGPFICCPTFHCHMDTGTLPYRATIYCSGAGQGKNLPSLHWQKSSGFHSQTTLNLSSAKALQSMCSFRHKCFFKQFPIVLYNNTCWQAQYYLHENMKVIHFWGILEFQNVFNFRSELAER